MKDIYIIGASGLGKEVKTILDALNEEKITWNIKGFIDDGVASGTLIIDGIMCLGSVEDLINKITSPTSVVIGIADRASARVIYQQLQDNQFLSFPNIIHPRAEITSGVKFGIGNVVTYGCILSCDVSLGNFNFFNSFAIIGHDCNIKNFNCFMPRVQISGGVEMGELNFFGMSAAIVQNKRVGNRNTINAFTFLSKSIGNDRKYFGIPGRRIKN